MSSKPSLTKQNRMKDTTVTTTTTTKAEKKKKLVPIQVPAQKFNGQLTVDIPECITHYGMALVNPFDCPAGVCLPCGNIPIPTQKFKTYRRGAFALGTTGVGFIRLVPGLSNDTAYIFASSATSVGTQATAFSAFTNVSNLTIPQNPFTTASFDATRAARIVGVGLRIKYIGPIQNTNGVICGLEEPNHQELSGNTFDGVAAHPNSEIQFAANFGKTGCSDLYGGWDYGINYSGPVNVTDFELISSTERPLGATSFLCIPISGVAGDKYEFEVVQHFEMAGVGIVSKTKSHVDAALAAKVLEAAKGITENKPLTLAQEPSFWSDFAEGVQKTLPHAVNLFKGGIGLATGNWTSLADVKDGLLGLYRTARGERYEYRPQPGEGPAMPMSKITFDKTPLFQEGSLATANIPRKNIHQIWEMARVEDKLRAPLGPAPRLQIGNHRAGG